MGSANDHFEVLSLHSPEDGPHCDACGDDWPCLVARQECVIERLLAVPTAHMCNGPEGEVAERAWDDACRDIAERMAAIVGDGGEATP